MRGTKRNLTLMPLVALAGLSLAFTLPALSSTVHAAPPVAYATVRVQPGETLWALAEAKTAPGGDLLVIGSAHLTTHFAAAGVLDELRIMVCPIVLGSGRSLFEDLKNRISLTLLGLRQFDSGNVLLTYRPSP